MKVVTSYSFFEQMMNFTVIMKIVSLFLHFVFRLGF